LFEKRQKDFLNKQKRKVQDLLANPKNKAVEDRYACIYILPQNCFVLGVKRRTFLAIV
jgi:hypothetical protein